MDALEDLSGSNDHLIIIKGKRNKRPRLPSVPVSRAVISSSLSGGESGCDDIGSRHRPEMRTATATSKYGGTKGTTGLISYAPYFNMCSDDSIESAYSSTLEDENMANCLIHLAQSGGNCVNQEEMKMKSYTTNKRLSEMVSDSTTKSKGGFFVYECKTCNRNFPSFQALGGHRASHKKPKILMEDQKTIFLPSCKQNLDENHEEEVAGGKFKRLSDDIISPEITIKLGQKESVGNQKVAAKIHECLICGSEFSSGQALGGHMRRHRNSSNAKLVNNNNSIETAREKSSPARRVFQLDLNLPAPEDDHRDLKFQFASPGPALVDCHY